MSAILAFESRSAPGGRPRRRLLRTHGAGDAVIGKHLRVQPLSHALGALGAHRPPPPLPHTLGLWFAIFFCFY